MATGSGFWIISHSTISNPTFSPSQLSENYTWVISTKPLMFFLPCYVFRRISLMGWNRNLLSSICICIHVKSGGNRSSTQGLGPTDIQLNLAKLGFILEKKNNQRQVFTAEPKACTFHKTCVCSVLYNLIIILGLNYSHVALKPVFLKAFWRTTTKKDKKPIQQRLQNQKGYQEKISTKVLLHFAMHYWTVIKALECLTA